ncbi:MAG TPA: hypothetical protein VH590_09835 [Ktedonobacterales bacterium]
MGELDAQPPASLAAGRSRKLTAVVIALAILPLLLPFLFALVELRWIYPMLQEQVLQCADSMCMDQAETYWERVGWLVTLGPSFLIALASILLGTIGLARARRHITSPQNVALFMVSLALGICWVVLGLCIYGVIFGITGIVP